MKLLRGKLKSMYEFGDGDDSGYGDGYGYDGLEDDWSKAGAEVEYD